MAGVEPWHHYLWAHTIEVEWRPMAKNPVADCGHNQRMPNREAAPSLSKVAGPIGPRLDRLDHLRAMAALMVLFWHITHAWFPKTAVPKPPILSLFEEGHVGVSFFCVISGFIFTHLYYGADISYGAFLRKRLLRVMPLFVMMVCLSYYTSGWAVADIIGMFATGLVRGGLPSYVGPGWSVLIEMQFYLLLPFLLIFTRRYGFRYLVGALITCLLVRTWVYVGFGKVQELAYYTLFGRMDQFLVGMMMARLAAAPGIAQRFLRPVMATALFVIAVFLLSKFYKWFNTQGGLMGLDGVTWPSKSSLWIVMPTIEALFFGVIVVTYLHLPKIRGFGWLSRAVAYIGVVSYSIYLTHMMSFAAVLKTATLLGFTSFATWNEAALVTAIVGVPLIVAVASVTYFVIELPFLQLKQRVVAVEANTRQHSTTDGSPSAGDTDVALGTKPVIAS